VIDQLDPGDVVDERENLEEWNEEQRFPG